MFFCCCFELLKKEHITNFNAFSPKKEEHLFWIFNFSFVWWATFLTNSSYKPHGIYLSGSTFLLHQDGPKQSQSILSISSRGWNPLPGACSDLDVKKPVDFIAFKGQIFTIFVINTFEFNIIIIYFTFLPYYIDDPNNLFLYLESNYWVKRKYFLGY